LNILLINPNRIKPAIPPIGLDYLYDSLKELSYKITFFDFSLQRPGTFNRVIQEQKFDVVGISIRNIDDVNIFRKKEFISPLKKMVNSIRRASEAKIILGGVGFSLLSHEIMQETGSDFGIIGDGEFTFPDLLKHLNCPEKVPNVLFKSNDCNSSIIQTKSKNVPMNKFPAYSRSLVNYKNYRLKNSVCNIQTKRGCNHRCIYCPEPQLSGNQIRVRQPEAIIEELSILSSYGVNDKIFFVDSEFNVDQEHAYQVCNEIAKRNIKINWSCSMMPQNVTRDLIHEMKKAGCYMIVWSIDTASEKMIQNLHKNFDLSDIFKVSQYCDEMSLPCCYSLLFGGPGEDRDTINESYNNISKTKAAFIAVGAGIRIYPRTQLYQLALMENEVTKTTSMLYPVYYKERYTNNFIIPYIKNIFASLSNCVMFGCKVNDQIQYEIDKVF